MDDRRFEMEGIFSATMSGVFRGQPTRFYYESGGQIPGGTGGGYVSPTFHVAVSCRSPFTLEVSERSKLSKLFGVSMDVKTGDPELDQYLAFSPDTKTKLLIHWTGRPEVKEKLTFLVLTEKCSLQLTDGFLVACYAGGDIKGKMQPGNVRQVLENLQALAQSLEPLKT